MGTSGAALKIGSAVLGLCFILAIGGPISAQSHDLFDAQRRDFRGSGWTIGIGGHGWIASPQESPSLWSVVTPDGLIDTLHMGTWTHESTGSPRLEFGHWRVSKRPILWDRWSLQAAVNRHAVVSTFTGMVADESSSFRTDTLVDETHPLLTSELTFRIHRAVELKPDFFVDVELGCGWDREWGMVSTRTGADSLFIPRPVPSSNRIALEAGLGMGVRTRTGRFLRLMVRTDWLQLHPSSEQGNGKIQWYEGTFQPFHATLQWDILRLNPDISCAGAVTEQRPAMELFEPTQMKTMQKKSRKKRTKKSRKRRF